MSPVQTLPQPAFPSTTTDSLCRQLTAYQSIIDARGAELCAPTPQEINLQSRMISNIIRIHKFNALDHAAKAMKSFVSFLGKGDKKLAKTIAEKMQQFLGEDIAETPHIPETTPNDPARDNAPDNPAPLATLQTIVASLAAVAKPDVPTHPQPAPAPEKFLLDPPPITEAFYNLHKINLFDVYQGHHQTNIMLEGVPYNKQWLEYNMLQYTLPTHQRRFIDTPEKYHRQIDHNETKQKIIRHLEG